MRLKKNVNQTSNNSLNSLNRNMVNSSYFIDLNYLHDTCSAPLYEAPFLYMYVL